LASWPAAAVAAAEEEGWDILAVVGFGNDRMMLLGSGWSDEMLESRHCHRLDDFAIAVVSVDAAVAADVHVVAIAVGQNIPLLRLANAAAKEVHETEKLDLDLDGYIELDLDLDLDDCHYYDGTCC